MARETRSARYRSAGSGDQRRASVLREGGDFRREGQYWTVGYGGNCFRRKDTKGLGYVAHLLRHPAAEFQVLDLVGGIASHREEERNQSIGARLASGDEDLEMARIHITRPGDAGEMLERAGQGRIQTAVFRV